MVWTMLFKRAFHHADDAVASSGTPNPRDREPTTRRKEYHGKHQYAAYGQPPSDDGGGELPLVSYRILP
jgi:hypothetical protein